MFPGQIVPQRAGLKGKSSFSASHQTLLSLINTEYEPELAPLLIFPIQGDTVPLEEVEIRFVAANVRGIKNDS
jgi:hypothetical protein